MYIQDSRYRILYQLISAAVFGHREITGDLEHTDIHIMYSILNSQHLCPALYIAKACMNKFPGEWDNHTICGGKFVTKLAESYGLLTTNFISTLEPVGRVYILDIRSNRRLNETNEPNHKSWVLLHDASPHDTPTQEIYPEAMHVETTESALVQPLPTTALESWPFHPDASSSRLFASSSHQGASSSHQIASSPVPGFLSFQDLLEFPEIPSIETLFELPETSSPQGLPEFSDLLLPEIPTQLSLEEIFQEISPPPTIYLGESSSHQGVPMYHQDIPPPTPIVQAPPTFEDLVREVQELKKNLAEFTTEIKKELADLTTWLKNRLS